MVQDEIIEKIHRVREEYSRSFNHDLKAIFADLQKRQAESGKTFVDLSRQQSSSTRWSRQIREQGEHTANPTNQCSIER